MKKVLLVIALVSGLFLGATAQTYPNISLWNIQYNAEDSVGAVPNSAYMNTFVNTGGIVTAAYTGAYYVQTSYAHEWAAIFVYDNTHFPSVGDSITFSGEVIEYYNETEMQTITNFVTVSNGNQARTPVTIVAFDSIQRRKYQAMLVKVKDVTCLHYNAAQKWYAFYDSTVTKSKPSEDTIDNIIYVNQRYTPGKKYNVTGVIHFEYANWIEPRNIGDIDSINVTGIDELPNNTSDVNIYPNPNNGVFTVSINAVNDERNTQIMLIDLAGRVIYKEQVDIYSGSNSMPVNISNLEKGIYLLQVSNPQSNIVKKVIVQ